MFFGEEFLCKDHHAIAVFVVAETDLTGAEERVHRRIDAHHFLHVIAGGFFEFGVLLAELPEELLDADGKRDQLRLLDDDGDGALILIGM